MVLGQGADVVRALAYVEKRVRPAAARVSDPAIFQVPHGHAVFCKRACQRTAVIDVVFRKPTTAVNVDDDGERSRSFRQSKLSELKGIWAVAMFFSRGGLGELGQVGPGDRRWEVRAND